MHIIVEQAERAMEGNFVKFKVVEHHDLKTILNANSQVATGLSSLSFHSVGPVEWCFP